MPDLSRMASPEITMVARMHCPKLLADRLSTNEKAMNHATLSQIHGFQVFSGRRTHHNLASRQSHRQADEEVSPPFLPKQHANKIGRNRRDLHGLFA
jgi:hypothetical protein